MDVTMTYSNPLFGTLNPAFEAIEGICSCLPQPFGLFGAALVVARSLAARPSAE
jgi:hypothetical protein